MIIHWPQAVLAILLLLRFAIHADKNGETREDKYAGGSAFLAACIWFGLLYAGGFWTGGQ